jgi:hypothetical protein
MPTADHIEHTRLWTGDGRASQIRCGATSPGEGARGRTNPLEDTVCPMGESRVSSWPVTMESWMCRAHALLPPEDLPPVPERHADPDELLRAVEEFAIFRHGEAKAVLLHPVRTSGTLLITSAPASNLWRCLKGAFPRRQGAQQGEVQYEDGPDGRADGFEQRRQAPDQLHGEQRQPGKGQY